MKTNTINHLITTTYTSVKGVLTSSKWDDGRMRHHDLCFQGIRGGKSVTIRWSNVSIFTFNGDSVYFVAKRDTGVLDEKMMENIINVDTK